MTLAGSRPMILIDGIARSGTSLLGRMMQSWLEPQGYAYYYEPFQHPTPAGTFEGWRRMIDQVLVPGDEAPELRDYLDRMRGGRPKGVLWKEIRLALKQDWLLAQYPDLRIVHITRDILGVLSSHHREGAPEWMARHRAMWVAAFRRWNEQGEKLRLKGIKTEPIRAGEGEDEIYSRMWVLNETFVRGIEGDGRLICIRHEDLCADAGGTIQKVAEFLGVPFTREERSAAEAMARETTGIHDPSGPGPGGDPGAIPEIWRRRMNSHEIEAIERVAGPTRQRLGYPPAGA